MATLDEIVAAALALNSAKTQLDTMKGRKQSAQTELAFVNIQIDDLQVQVDAARANLRAIV